MVGIVNMTHGGHGGSKTGQVVLEYVIVAGILVAVVSMMALLLYTFKENGGRVLDLIGSDSP